MQIFLDWRYLSQSGSDDPSPLPLHPPSKSPPPPFIYTPVLFESRRTHPNYSKIILESNKLLEKRYQRTDQSEAMLLKAKTANGE